MIRGEWKFQYKCSTLTDAARTKVYHHKKRLEFWEEKKRDTIKAIRERGIEVVESISERGETSMSFVSNRSPGAMSPQIMIDKTLDRDLQETAMKIQEHRAKITEYDSWVQVLDSQGDQAKDLDYQDWLFFFGK